ncbi:MAG TPA: redox-sensing transcriptional repressor Rex [Acidimicrobiales bacterium]|nr:redox-sensing transcriptional repressor Rex [Acidimicrobiales bacterium]
MFRARPCGPPEACRTVASVGGTGGRGRSRIPGPTVSRLPVYHRALVVMLERQRGTVSSSELAEATGVNAATLRRDLSHLGSYGTRGTGYDVSHLLGRVDRALALDREWPVAIVGVGNLGRALARSGNFSARGFRVAALVDVDPASVGTTVDGLLVEHLDHLAEAVRRERVEIAVVATPAGAAQDVADRLVGAGVRVILNFAPAVVQVDEGVRLRNVDLAAELQVLAFYGSRLPPAETVRDAALPAPAAGRARRRHGTAGVASGASTGTGRPRRPSS